MKFDETVRAKRRLMLRDVGSEGLWGLLSNARLFANVGQFNPRAVVVAAQVRREMECRKLSTDTSA